MLRADEIRELSDDELRARVAQLEEERFRLKFRSATETLEDPLRLRFIRRDIARLKTIAHERKLGVARGGTQPAAGGESSGAASGAASGEASAKAPASAARKSV